MKLCKQNLNTRIIRSYRSLNNQQFIISLEIYCEWCITWTKGPFLCRHTSSCPEPLQVRTCSALPDLNTCKMLMCILLQILAAFTSLQTSSGIFSSRCSDVEQVQVTSGCEPFRLQIVPKTLSDREGVTFKSESFFAGQPFKQATCPQAGMSKTSCPLALSLRFHCYISCIRFWVSTSESTLD